VLRGFALHLQPSFSRIDLVSSPVLDRLFYLNSENPSPKTYD